MSPPTLAEDPPPEVRAALEVIRAILARREADRPIEHLAERVPPFAEIIAVEFHPPRGEPVLDLAGDLLGVEARNVYRRCWRPRPH